MIENAISELKEKRAKLLQELTVIENGILALERADRILKGEPPPRIERNPISGTMPGLRVSILKLIDEWPDSEPITQRAIRKKLNGAYPDAKQNSLTASIATHLKRLTKTGVLEISGDRIRMPNGFWTAFEYQKAVRVKAENSQT